jgi:hypothetical protein
LALSLPQLWAIVAVVLPVVALQGSLGTVDLTYHLRAGDLMLHTHHLIRADSFTFTARGLPWLDQQWGAQLILALVFKPLGWAGLAGARAALVGTASLFLYLACRAAGSPPRWASCLALAAIGVGFLDLSLRPQLLGVVLFAVSLWLVWGRRAHPARLWAVPAVVTVWANLHGSFFLGPMLVGLAWLEDRRERSSRADQTFRVAAAAAVAATLNPLGLRVWSYAVGISTNARISRLINEWQPPSIREPDGAIFFLSVVAVAVVLARRGRSLPWPLLLSLGVFFAIGLTATRNTLWWGFGVSPLLATLFTEGSDRSRVELPPSLLNSGIAACLALLVFALFPWSFVGKSDRSPDSHLSFAPAGITATLDQVLEPGEAVFNPQAWGSWFELVFPENPVFIDSRIEVFPDSVWRDHASVSIGRQGWQGVLDRWEVQVVVAERREQALLIPLIRHDPGWRLVYEDDDGLVFARASPLST